MTLDEAIEHAEAEGLQRTECGRQHRQLAEWLRELRDRRKADPHRPRELGGSASLGGE